VDAKRGSASPRPYVVFGSSELVFPSGDAKPLQVVFYLKNTGQAGAVGTIRDFTYYFSIRPEQKEFAYQTSEPTSFSLAPSEQWRAHFLPTFVLTPEKRTALESGRARLFVYARGEYRDESGRVYQLLFARMYHPLVAGNLAIPPDNVTFR
jgi:hypothetical protein